MNYLFGVIALFAGKVSSLISERVLARDPHSCALTVNKPTEH